MMRRAAVADGRTLARLHLPLATDAEQARERTKQIPPRSSQVKRLKIQLVGLKLINAGGQFLLVTRRRQVPKPKLHIDNVSVVFGSGSRDEKKYGLKVEFKLK